MQGRDKINLTISYFRNSARYQLTDFGPVSAKQNGEVIVHAFVHLRSIQLN